MSNNTTWQKMFQEWGGLNENFININSTKEKMGVLLQLLSNIFISCIKFIFLILYVTTVLKIYVLIVYIYNTQFSPCHCHTV